MKRWNGIITQTRISVHKEVYVANEVDIELAKKDEMINFLLDEIIDYPCSCMPYADEMNMGYCNRCVTIKKYEDMNDD